MDPSQATPADTPVMVVDDDPDVLASMRKVIERLGFPVTTYTDPLEAKAAIDGGNSPHLLIADKNMPGMDGLSLARHAMESDPSTATIVVTGQGDVQAAMEALRLGALDYLLKPLEVSSLEFAVRRALQTRELFVLHRQQQGDLSAEVEEKSRKIEAQAASLEELTVASLSALVQLLESRSKYFVGHSQAVSRLAMKMARVLSLPEPVVEDIRVAGLLLDIGMISVPDALIFKRGDLTDAEVKTIREHPRLAERVLRPFKHLGAAVDYVLHHHERLDGSGYPEGLFGPQLSIGAEILGCADMYQALVEERPHREAHRPREALWTLRGAEGMWFSRRMLDALEAAIRKE